MTEQMNNIESLQTEVNQVKTDLDLLKAETNETIKQTKAESLEQDVSATKEKIKKELDILKGLTDATSLENTRKLEAMLLTLETSNTELETLKVDVNQNNVPSSTPEDNTDEEVEDNEDEEEKEKKNWFKKQIDGFTDSTEENHGLKNTARIAGGIGIVAAGIRGIKKLFGRGKKNKEKKEGKEDSEKKGFWKSKFGKVLKWTGIGTVGYYLTHGFITGRWNLKDFFDWNKKEQINPDDLKSWYEKNVDAALKPKYDKFAGMVDEYRKNTGNTDSLGVLEDKNNNKIEIPRGAIPAAMDDAYDNVGDILDTNDDILNKRGTVGCKMRGLVTSVSGKIIGGLFRGAVGMIKGLKSSMFDANGKPNEEFKEWAKKDDLTRDEQVANLLQKYSMVRTYLNDKRKQLTRKYTIDQLKLEGISNPTEEQIEEYELNKDLVAMRVETDFLSKKIVSLGAGSSASDTLEDIGILDSSVSIETQAVLDEVKGIRKEIIPDETLRSRAKASPDVNQNEGLRTELDSVSTKFSTHLKEGVLDRNILEGIANAWGILNLDELWNSKADDLEEAIEKLGFGDEVKRFALKNNDFYNKLQNKTLTKADIEDFEKTINDYFSLLQQVMLETQTQQENETGFGVDRMKTWFMGRMYELVLTPTGWIIMSGALLNGLVKRKFKMKKSPIRRTFDQASKPLKFLYRKPIRKVNVPSILGNRYLKISAYGNKRMGYDNFINDIKKGRISYDDAKFVYGRKHGSRGQYGNLNDAYFSTFVEKELHVTNNIDMLEYLNNKNIRNILNKNNIRLSDLAESLNKFDDELKKLPAGKAQEFCNALIKKSKFNTISDLDNLTKNINKIDFSLIENMDDKAVRKIAKELGENISTLKTADAINAKITDLKKAASAVNQVLENAKVQELYKRIDIGLSDAELKLKNIKANPSAPNYSGGRVKYYEDTVESIKKFRNEAKNLSEVEYKTVLKFVDNGFDVSSMAKLHNIFEQNAPGAKTIKMAMETGDISLLKKCLKDAPKEQGLKGIITTTDVDDIIKNLDIFNSKMVSGVDDVGLLLKGMVKIFTKLT